MVKPTLLSTDTYLFVNGTEIIKLKAKDSEITASPLCLGNISRDWSVDNMKKKKQGLMVMSDVDDIKDIHKYFMKKNDIV